MILKNNTMKYRVFILALMLMVNACSSTNKDVTLLEKPKQLVIKESIIAESEKSDDEKTSEVFVENNTIVDEKKLTEPIVNVSGLRTLEQAAKIPPIFVNTDKVTISVDAMSVIDFIHYIFDDLLKLNYVVSSQIEANKEQVSLNLNDPVTKERLYTMSKELLEDNDIAMLRKDDIVYFQKKNKDKRYQNALVGIGRFTSDIPESTGKIVQVIPYIYTNSRNLTSVIKKLTGIEVKIDARLRVLMVEGSKNDIVEVMRVLRMLDVPSAVGKEIRLINLAYISPDTLVDKLKELLENDGYAVGMNNDITFVTMPRIGAVVVYAVSLGAVERVELWSEKLDIAIAGNEPQFYVYRPQFNKAVDLQGSLGAIINTILGVKDGSSNVNNTSANTGINNPTQTNNQSATSSMSVDEDQNALVFYTTSGKYRKILQLLQKLDLLPGQVILDIAIAEITLSDSLSSGVNWGYDSRGKNGDNILSSLTGSILDTGGLNLVGIDGNWDVALSFLRSKQNVKVLSKPFFIVKDGESATINSGSQIPTITQESTTDTGNVTNSVQYITTGIQVAITPTINAKGLINLDISMSSSTPNGDSLTPTINSRSIRTNVFSGDGQTVALGGLIQETLTDDNNKVPFLSSIPILGNLFGKTGDTYVRTELMMLITTRIVKSVNEIDEFRGKILDLYNFPLSEKVSNDVQ